MRLLCFMSQPRMSIQVGFRFFQIAVIILFSYDLPSRPSSFKEKASEKGE